jgi:hypothetical protein
MPYVSDAQRRWAHTATGTKALGGPDKVAEWDRASKGKDLPMYSKGTGAKTASYAKGGPVVKEGRDMFMKQPVIFRAPLNTEKRDYGAKKDPLCNYEGDGKSLKPIKPRT